MLRFWLRRKTSRGCGILVSDDMLNRDVPAGIYDLGPMGSLDHPVGAKEDGSWNLDRGEEPDFVPSLPVIL